ncbi:MAG: M20 family metallopeptidase, partial [Thermoplasmata archaeon]|nr:M20 family metallopeptidase [Thermoplasmata archaeon]NIY03160.1 M20/M25/M40 family metallo-hydrolase [Thermoplasmata archaeon]
IALRTGNPNCFVLGPGNIDYAHGPDEFVEVEELHQGLRLIARAAELVLEEGRGAGRI